MVWTTPGTWVAGETVTAALLNTHVRDNLNAIGGAWTSYTSSWGASTTNPSLGNGTLVAAYMQAGKYVAYRILLTAGSTTTVGSGFYTFMLPTSANTPNAIGVGSGMFSDSSGALYPIIAYTSSVGTNAIAMIGSPSTGPYASTGRWSSTATVTIANGDTVGISGIYESV